eukprot:GHVO01025327.1.p1 GENE.GHVO01025327.1~~GHVO01025327.1.p1  ORF type:complete len:239 (+),score=65.13 GHVO01025327.1:23-739(+)
MSDADWDAEDFEPQEVGAAAVVASDKWDGEDEDGDVKDNWDEEDTKENDNKITATQVKKKKSLKDRIAEKEAKRKEEAEKKRKEEEAIKDLTPEDAAAEKLRQQKLQEDADLELMKGLVGTNEELRGDSIDSMLPSSKEDFNQFQELVTKKISSLSSSAHYVTFLENLYRDLCLSCESEDIKRLASTLNALANEKNKLQKGPKSKKKGAKSKANLKAGKTSDFGDYQVEAMDDFDDFI